MKILFAIAVVSFAALVWAALAMMRHVRKSAATLPGSDAEMSEALDVRLAEMARQQSEQRVSASGNRKDFSYFDRDTASSLPDRYSVEPQPGITPAIAEHL